MAKITGIPKIDLEVTITLTEDEAGALHALLGYDVESFLDVFYREMGKAYLEPYEKGIRSLHQSHGFLSSALRQVETARVAFYAKL